MSFAVTLSEVDGVPVARKSVLDGAAEARARLEAEAGNLASMQHPGIVRLVSWDGDTLVTEFAGRPVRQIVTVPTELAARMVVSLAHTVADLHETGLAHMSVDESHVLVGQGEHPRLCSLGSLAPTTAARQSDDVAGLGVILRHLIGDVGDGDPIPEHRGMFRRGRGRAQQYERRGLLTIADQATADVPGHRPTARRFAQMVAETVPSAHPDRPVGTIGRPRHFQAHTGDPRNEGLEDLECGTVSPTAPSEGTDLPFPHPALADLVVPDTPAELFAPPEAEPEPTTRPVPDPPWPGDETTPAIAEAPTTPSRDHRAVAATLAAIVGAALIVAGILGLTRNTDPELSASAVDPATTATAPSTSTTAADASAADEARPSPTVPPPTTTTTATCGTAHAPDLDGDGCGDDLAVEGTIVRVGDARFQVGRDDDVVALGDWDCDGTVTPALLRPATGDVFVFADWTESEVVVQPLDHVEMATHIAPEADGIGCHLLVVTDARGRRTTLDAR